MLLYELTRGLAYLRIRHPSIDWYTIRLPVLASALLCVAYAALPMKPQLVGPDGLFSDLLSILATLPGFYFAGLAAIATFDRPGMDVEIPSPAPSLAIQIGGKVDVILLTKRMFLSYLFSYLTTLSLAVCVLILVINAMGPSIAAWVGEWQSVPNSKLIFGYARVGLFALVIVPITSLAVSTLHGIFFLTERVHQAS